MKKILLGAAALCLVACQGEAIVDSQALADTEWVLKYSQSDIGLKESLEGLFTVKFGMQSQVEISHQCGTYSATYTAQYSDNGLSAPMQISSMGSAEDASCDTESLMAYQNILNTITDYDLEGDRLDLKEGDVTSLILERRFNLCATPASLSGNPGNDMYAPVSVWLDFGDTPHADVIQHFDTQYPDFTVMPSSECDARVLANMNRNTLDQLRCNDAISLVTYR